MAEFVIKLADERGHVQEQVQSAATADELRARFSHAGYHVFAIRARGSIALGRRIYGPFGGIIDRPERSPFMLNHMGYLSLVLYAASFLCYARILYVPNLWVGRTASLLLACGIALHYFAHLHLDDQ